MKYILPKFIKTSFVFGIYCYAFSAMGAGLPPQQQQAKPPKVIEKLEIDYDRGVNSLKDLLEPIPQIGYVYNPIIKNIIINTEIGNFIQYAINKFSHDHVIINPNVGAGLLWKGWLYTGINGGYGVIKAKTLPESDQSKKYEVYGPFLNFMVGYNYAYSEDNALGIILELGGTYYKQYIKATNYRKDKNTALWIKLLFDTKSRIFDNSNLFIGTQVGMKLLLLKSKTPKLNKFVIPYYGASSNKIGLSCSLYLHYSIPLYRKFVSI